MNRSIPLILNFEIQSAVDRACTGVIGASRRAKIDVACGCMFGSHRHITHIYSSRMAPGLVRSALEAAQKGEDCTNKIFCITGAYSGLGM